jgi:hypothetical protein
VVRVGENTSTAVLVACFVEHVDHIRSPCVLVLLFLERIPSVCHEVFVVIFGRSSLCRRNASFFSTFPIRSGRLQQIFLIIADVSGWLLPFHIGGIAVAVAVAVSVAIAIHTRVRLSTSLSAIHDGFLADFGRAFTGRGQR